MPGPNPAVMNRTGTIFAGLLEVSTVIDDTTAAWTETTTLNATTSLATSSGTTDDDPLSPPKGVSIARVTCATVAAGSVLMSVAIASTDFSNDGAVVFYFRPSVALTTGDMRLLLDSATVAGDGSDLEDLDLPALPTANVWYRIALRLNDPVADTAIVSIGIAFGAGVTTDGVYDVYVPRKLFEVEGMKNFSTTQSQGDFDLTDYQSGSQNEYTRTVTDWTMSFGGNKERAPQLVTRKDYVVAIAESNTIGQMYVGDGHLSSLSGSGSYDANVEQSYEVRGTAALQLPLT